MGPGGWSDGKTTEHAGVRLHGPWGDERKDVESQFTVPSGASKCTLSWRSWGIASRDNEEDRMYVDGKEMWKAKVPGAGNCDKGWRKHEKLSGDRGPLTKGWNVCYIDVTKTFDCKQGQLTVKFTSGIDQKASTQHALPAASRH